MRDRDREIREMPDRAWRKEEQKRRGFLTLSENDMRLLEDYYAAGRMAIRRKALISG